MPDPPELSPELLLIKELARKLAWAVRSTLATPRDANKRLRAWSWRLADRLVAAKKQFMPVDTILSARYAKRAGGGAVVGNESAVRRSNEEPTTANTLPGGKINGFGTFSWITVAPHCTERRGPCPRFRPKEARCDRSGCWDRGAGRIWCATGADYGWGDRWAPSTPA